MSNANRKTIEIRHGHEYRLFVDKKIYDQSKFFYSVYKKSAELVNEICKPKEDLDNEQSTKYYPNNIIMYCAERGGGKSSAMLSFGSALSQFGKGVSADDKKGFDDMWGNTDLTRRFAVLDVIDPTTIFEKEIFMRIILSRMFSELRVLWKNADNNIRDNQYSSCVSRVRNDIVERFRKCYGLIDVIYQRRGEFDRNDDIEELSDLGDSNNLKKEFKDLVDLYLKEIYPNSNNSYLVIQLDDADLNTKMAYSIIEDIRKYCIIPNVLILIAVNMEQMHQIIEQHFIDDFKTLFDVRTANYEQSPIDLKDTADMAVRYINKLMPSSHQLHLPKIDDYLRNNMSDLDLAYHKLVIENGVKKTKDELSYKVLGTEDDIIQDYQQRLIRLIYRKTGIALVKPEHYTHNFLPQNMRELAHFLSYFCSMPDLEAEYGFAEIYAYINDPQNDDEEKAEKANQQLLIRKNNLEALEQYFVKTWSDINLSRKNHKMIMNLAHTVDSLKIEFAIEICNDLLIECKKDKEIDVSVKQREKSETQTELFETQGEISGNELKNADNQSGQTDCAANNLPKICEKSYAALMRKIQQLSKKAVSKNDFMQTYKMVYALRLYFTIFLHRQALNCIETKDFDWFYNVINGELWIPDYEAFSDNSHNGRFIVDYNMLIRLNPALKNINGEQQNKNDFNQLAEYCYITSNSVNTRLKTNSVFSVISKIGRSSNGINGVIIFDLGMSLLNKLFNESNYNANDPTTLTQLNLIFTILMNWDVNHFIDKQLQKKFEDSSSPTNWCKKFLSLISRLVSQIDYIGFNRDIELLLDSKKNINMIHCSNLYNSERYIADVISQMNDVINKYSKPVEDKETSVIQESLAFFINAISTLYEIYHNYFSPFLSLSQTIQMIYERIVKMKNLYSIIYTNDGEHKLLSNISLWATSQKDNNAVVQERNKYIDSVHEYNILINELKIILNNPGLCNEIFDEIYGTKTQKAEPKSAKNKSRCKTEKTARQRDRARRSEDKEATEKQSGEASDESSKSEE